MLKTATLSLIVLMLTSTIAANLNAAEHWVTYEGKDGPGKGKHIVFVSGDDEYIS